MRNFVVFEKIREYSNDGDNNGGGGVAIAAKNELNPILVSEGDKNVEAITIYIHTKNIVISCTSAYGPQNNAKTDRKSKFWSYLDNVTESANKKGICFILEGDLNAWLGDKVISGDPNPQNDNGKLFQQYLWRHPQLSVVNSLSLCNGVITRQRKLNNGKEEKSVLDFYVVCSRLLSYVSKMTIDNDNRFSLTNYYNVKRGGTANDSDHFTVILNIALQLCPLRQQKRVIYNFKNISCQKKFTEMTKNSKAFKECFNDNYTVVEQCSKWLKVFNDYCSKAFNQIKIKKNKIKQPESYSLINERNKLKKIFDKTQDKCTKDRIFKLEKKIVLIVEKEEKNKAYIFRQYCDQFSSFPVQNMWKLKKKLWPKKPNSLPVAKFNHIGQLVSSPSELKSLLIKEYKERLRSRAVRTDFIDQKQLDKIVTDLKLSCAWLNKSEAFSSSEVTKALNDLNTGKARDPQGLCSEIFKPSVIGQKVKMSLGTMMNRIKKECQIPTYFRRISITSIPKIGSKFNLENERGISGVSIFRTILLRLIYNRKYNIIESNMSDSNVGGRKNKSCRNHIWILNGIIHEHNKSKSTNNVTIQYYDYRQMFDSMSLPDVISDMYDVGMIDDTLSLLNGLNTDVTMSVKTPYGETDTVLLPTVVAQGDLMSPINASVQVDSMAKEQLMEEEELAKEGKAGILYKYKGIVTIPILGMMDDTAAVTVAGYKAQVMNTYVNTHTAHKLLQFNAPKCKYMNCGNYDEMYIKQSLEVDSWKITYDKKGNLNESYDGKKEMKEVTEHKYLGFIISSNGSNVADIRSKSKKSIGTIAQIINITKGLGTYTFECTLIYIKSLLRGSTLYASETYYSLTESEVRTLESIDKNCLKQILKTGKHCPTYLLYLELGLCPARYHIIKLKLGFLFYILQQDRTSLLGQFFQAQVDFPTVGDWTSEIKGIILDLKIDLSFSQIKVMKKCQFYLLVQEKVNKHAFIYLTSKIKSKGKEIIYKNELRMQHYLSPNSVLTLDEQRNIFAYRLRMNSLNYNFPGKQIIDKCICGEVMNNEHLFSCNILNNGKQPETIYQNIFNGTLLEQKYIINILETNMRKYEKHSQAQVLSTSSR